MFARCCPDAFYLRVQMLINVNSANKMDLERLPQVGPARSFKIYCASKFGGFRDRSAFGRVNGFGIGSSYWPTLSQYVMKLFHHCLFVTV
jgi:DNA uptake protein ComE-like DNA-binding protein